MKTTNPLSKRIRNIRESLGYSQEYVADQMNISQQMYSKIEKNPERTAYDRLKKLAFILQVDVITLLADNDQSNISQMPIASIEVSGNMTIQAILETHKRNLERMTQDISALNGKIGIENILNQDTK